MLCDLLRGVAWNGDGASLREMAEGAMEAFAPSANSRWVSTKEGMMKKRPDMLYWEFPVQPEGYGTTLWRQNHDAAEILEKLIPNYNPEQMVSDGEAVARDPDRYCLTAEGFGKFQMAAQKKKDFASIEFLKNWEKQVCLRPHKEWQEILSTGGGGEDTAR